ncbi:hypothetical protein B7463_g6671, partial [Scytalidium lignicola]
MATPSTTATPACQSALGNAEYYEHSKTEGWNSAIINSILRALISESSPPGGTPNYKFAVNSTIIQHLVPTSSLSKPKPVNSSSEGGSATETTPHAGRRGMHSASGCYWNEKTDGMWSFNVEVFRASLAAVGFEDARSSSPTSGTFCRSVNWKHLVLGIIAIMAVAGATRAMTFSSRIIDMAPSGCPGVWGAGLPFLSDNAILSCTVYLCTLLVTQEFLTCLRPAWTGWAGPGSWASLASGHSLVLQILSALYAGA